MNVIKINKYGGPEQLSYEKVSIPEPKNNEVRVKVEAAGVNYIDIYQRTGLYPIDLPYTPGMEAAGIVDEIGKNVSDIKIGDRVAFALNLGSYAEYVIVPSWILVNIPDNMDINSAAALMLQGMTAHYLTHSIFKIEKNHTILLHAAAGGVGLLLTQIAKKLGAKVIGTVSTEEKSKLAKNAGVDEIILYTKSDFEEEVKNITDGKGVDVVYDSVGKTTFFKSLKCLRLKGLLVSFGQSSGAIPDFNTKILSENGSLFLTRPTLANYASNKDEILHRSNDLFEWIKSGELNLRIHKTFPLSEAKEAQKELESRSVMGKLLLIP